MRNAEAVRQFERRLAQLGCPPATVRRLGRELEDHHEDLKLAAREAGLSDAEAEVRATAVLGEPLPLAERVAMVLRESSWWGRHPLVGFCLLPPLAIVAVVVGGLALEYGLAKLLLSPERIASIFDSGPGFDALATVVNCLPAIAIAFATLAFCRLSQRCAAGLKWTLAACVICALCGLFGYVEIKPHQIFVGMVNIPIWPNAAAALTPLLVAMAAFVRQRRFEGGMLKPVARSAASVRCWSGMLLLLTAFTGCANHHEQPVHSRGWIGGEYATIRQWKGFSWPNNSGVVYGKLPEAATGGRKSAVQISPLNTNTPASVAGFRAGDVVLELNHQPVTRLRDFRRRVDRATPGTVLPVKIYRDGQLTEHTVPVGRETYYTGGYISLVYPTVVRGWDLWPNPGFSLVFLGYQSNPGLRSEIRLKDAYDEEWSSWLGLVQVSLGKCIVERTNIAQETTSQLLLASKVK